MRESLARVLAITGLALVVAAAVFVPSARAAVPQLLNFQGILLDDDLGTVIDSTYDLTFRIFDDSTGGIAQWEENQTVKTENGLFNTFLGRTVPLPDSVFDGPNRFFEIELIGVGPYEPRNRIGSVAYAYRVNSVDGATGGSIYGDLQLHSGLTAGDDAGNAGFLEVTDGSADVFSMDGATATTSFSGPSSSIGLDMGASGDNAVMLPDNAIAASEVLDEPGISANVNGADVVLVQGSLTMTDLVTTTITIPADGYIVVRGRSNFTTSGTAGENIAYVQVDETAGGSDEPDYRSAAGIHAHSNSGTHNLLFTIYNDRVYFKTAGAYTFRLEARAGEENSDGATGTLSQSFITATFYPTSYGSVNMPSGFGSRTDLRDLELRAARLRADAERAQRELLEARLNRSANR